MVEIVGRRQVEQALQQTMQARRLEEIPAAHHVRHALQRVVDDDGDVIARGRILAGEDDVAPSRWIGANDPSLVISSAAS